MSASAPRFASVVLDVDSTLCGVEGVDWLAERRGGDVAEMSRKLTERAMSGDVPLELVYAERLAFIRPSRADVAALAEVYRERIAPGAADAIKKLKDAKVRVVLVSGGVKQAIAPLAESLGVELHAVSLGWDAKGEYQTFDQASPLTTNEGKLHVVRGLEPALVRPSLAVGDGATDIAMRDAVDVFAACTVFAKRQAVVAAAAREIGSYKQLVVEVLGASTLPHQR